MDEERGEKKGGAVAVLLASKAGIVGLVLAGATVAGGVGSGVAGSAGGEGGGG